MSAHDVTVTAIDDLPPSETPTDLPWQPVVRTDDVLLVRVDAADEASGWHSHGERDAYGVVLEGRLRVEYGADGESAVAAGPGEFVHVPAGTVHRDAADGDCVALVALAGAGDPLVEADGPADAAQRDREPRVAGEDDLVEASSLANLTRLTPFPDADVRQVRGHADGRVESDWHHHGDNDVFGYVRRGEGYVDLGPGEDERVRVRAGELFHLPAGVVHRDVNPSDEEQDYVLWLAGSDPRTVPVDGPPTR